MRQQESHCYTVLFLFISIDGHSLKKSICLYTCKSQSVDDRLIRRDKAYRCQLKLWPPTDRQKCKQCLREVEQKIVSFHPNSTQTHALDMPLHCNCEDNHFSAWTRPRFDDYSRPSGCLFMTASPALRKSYISTSPRNTQICRSAVCVVTSRTG